MSKKKSGKPRDKGLGIKHGQKPIPVKFHAVMDAKLRSLENTSEAIRYYTARGMAEDGFFNQEELEELIKAGILTERDIENLNVKDASTP